MYAASSAIDHSSASLFEEFASDFLSFRLGMGETQVQPQALDGGHHNAYLRETKEWSRWHGAALCHVS